MFLFMFHPPCFMFHPPCFMFHPPCFMFHPSCFMFLPPCFMFHPPCFMFHPPCFMFHPQVLFLLIGWDELNESEAGDLLDLVEGKLLPASTVLLSSRVDAPLNVLPTALNRVYRVTGLTTASSRQMLSRYCQTMSKVDFSHKVRELLVKVDPLGRS